MAFSVATDSEKLVFNTTNKQHLYAELVSLVQEPMFKNSTTNNISSSKFAVWFLGFLEFISDCELTIQGPVVTRRKVPYHICKQKRLESACASAITRSDSINCPRGIVFCNLREVGVVIKSL